MFEFIEVLVDPLRLREAIQLLYHHNVIDFACGIPVCDVGARPLGQIPIELGEPKIYSKPSASENIQGIGLVTRLIRRMEIISGTHSDRAFLASSDCIRSS